MKRREIRQKTISEPRSSGVLTAREYVICAALSIAFALILLMPYLHGHWRLGDDAYIAYLQRYLLQERIFKLDGAWEHWILNIGLGQQASLIAGQTLFYPVQALWGLVVGWSEKSYLWYMALHIAGGTFLAAVFARQAGISLAAALFFALSFAGDGYVLGTLSNPNLMFPHLFWPILISGLIDIQQGDRNKFEMRGMVKFAIGAFLIEVTSYPLLRILIFGSSAIGYWLMAKQPGTWFKGVRWKPVAVGGALAVLISAPEWMTTLPVLKFADRLGEDSYNEYTYNSPTNFLVWATALLPGVFDRRDVTQLGMVWLERTWWVGSVTLAMIFAATQKGLLSLKKLRIPVVIGIFALLFSMGGHTFVRELSAIVLLPLEYLRHSDYARFVVMTLLAWVGAVSLQSLMDHSEPAKNPGKSVAWIWATFFIACCWAALSEDKSLFQVQAVDLYNQWPGAWKIQSLHTAFFLLLAYTVFAYRPTLLGGWNWAVLMVAVQFISMADGGYAFRRLVAKEEPLHPAESFVLQTPHPNERSLRRWFDGDDWMTWHGNKVVLWGHNPPYHRWRDEAMNDPLASRALSTLVSCRDSVEYMLSDPKTLDGRPAAVSPVSLVRAPLSEFSCTDAKFQIDHYFGNTIEVSGSSSHPILIAAHDLYAPYWTATVNGNPAPILQAMHYFKAVEVPAGEFKVRFEYRDPRFPLLWYLSALACALLLGSGFWYPKLRARFEGTGSA